MKRTRYIPLIQTEEITSEDGKVRQDFEIEGGLQAAQVEAAACVEMLDRLGGGLVIAADQEQIDNLTSGDHQFQTRGFIFKYDSQMPTRRPPKPPVEEPAEQPEPEPVEG